MALPNSRMSAASRNAGACGFAAANKIAMCWNLSTQSLYPNSLLCHRKHGEWVKPNLNVIGDNLEWWFRNTVHACSSTRPAVTPLGGNKRDMHGSSAMSEKTLALRANSRRSSKSKCSCPFLVGTVWRSSFGFLKHLFGSKWSICSNLFRVSFACRVLAWSVDDSHA